MPAKVALSLDLHSGFGATDRIWYPYAVSRTPFPHLAEVLALSNLLDRSFPNHVYRIEPQCSQYLIEGDVWDYLYEHARKLSENLFLPFALEMGSWLWLKKNPLQIFSFLGPFNPIKPHRLSRTLRRHITLLDFLVRATHSHAPFSQLSSETRAALFEEGKKRWYAHSFS